MSSTSPLHVLLLLFCLLPVKGADVKAMTLCELLKTPEKFAGQMVSVRASVDKSYHWLVLFNKDCDGSVMLELRSEIEPKREFPLEKDEQFEKFDQALFDFKPGSMELRNRIEADFAGRFDSMFAMKRNRKVRIAKGYGHGLQAKTRLVLHKVSNVTIVAQEEVRGDRVP
jgi:hypothetical protein